MAKPGGRSRRVSNRLVGLGSAAVLTIYGAGYLRTRPAAARLALASERRTAAPQVPSTPAPQPAPALTPSDPDPVPVPVRAPATPAPVAAAKTRPRRTPRPAGVVAEAAPAKAAPLASAPVATRLPEPAAAVAVPAPMAALPPVATVVPETAALPAAPPSAPPLPAAAPKWKDGTFLGWGSSRHGDIQASVEVRGGRIVSATIAQCLTRYSCSWIAPLPPQVVARQSPEVDYVSGATQSTDAFYGAVVDALSKAK